MAPKFRYALFVAAATVAVSVAVGTPASAATYDLKTDWSDAANPNGPWTYREGNNALPSTDNWQGLGAAWAEGNGSPSSFLPAWLKVDSDVAGSYLTGDIIGHSYDNSNGGSNGEANVIFTSPVAGAATISGNIWEAHGTGIDRDQVWQVLVNDVVKASGVVLGDDSENRNNPDPFNFGIALGVGDVVKLLVVRDAGQQFGSVFGVNLTIDVTPSTSEVPLPGALPLLASVIGGVFGAQSWRRRKKRAATT